MSFSRQTRVVPENEAVAITNIGAVSTDPGAVNFDAILTNGSSVEKCVQLTVSVYDDGGDVIRRTGREVCIRGGITQTEVFEFFDLPETQTVTCCAELRDKSDCLVITPGGDNEGEEVPDDPALSGGVLLAAAILGGALLVLLLRER
jgi:hypothetical protein